MGEPESVTRLHGLDAARGILMALGIVLHASNVYAPGIPWIVDDPQSSPIFNFVTASIHAFRMPAFFWVSGFFCAMTFERTGSAGIVRSRLPRLLIPLLVAMFTLNVLQDILVGARHDRPIAQVLAEGWHLYHLWFLVNLIVYVAVAALLMPLWSPSESARPQLARSRALGYFGAIVLSTYLLVLAVRATGLAHSRVLGLTTPYSLAMYALFFGVGALMYVRRDLCTRFFAIPAWTLFPAVAIAIYLSPFTAGKASLMTETAELLHVTVVWISVGAIHGWFHRVFRRKTVFTRAASESTYTVYLFHHIVVVALALCLLPLPWGPSQKFAFIVAATVVVTLAIHYALIRPSAVLRLLFNGRISSARPSGTEATTKRGV